MIIGQFAGPLDILILMYDARTGRYHPAVFEERPMPGGAEPISEMKFVRLKSKGHHTTGFATLNEGLAGLDDWASRVKFLDGTICREPVVVAGDFVQVWVLPPWGDGRGLTLDRAIGSSQLLLRDATVYSALEVGSANADSITGEIERCPKCGLAGARRSVGPGEVYVAHVVRKGSGSNELVYFCTPGAEG